MRSNRFPGKSCVLCPSPSQGAGEHVWPRWLIGDFGDEGPFHTARGGVPYKTRDEEIARFEGMPGVHVPMCQPCNARLNSLVEEPAKPVVRKIFDPAAHGWPTLTPREAADLGRWFLKVGLLLAHPDADEDSPHVARDKTLDLREPAFRPEWVSWLATGVEPADAFTVYINHLDEGLPRKGSSAVILLPGRLRVGGQDVHFFARTVGLRDMQATIVWHPGWPILHPGVESGAAVVVWPPPGAPVELFDLSPVQGREVAFSLDGSRIVVSTAQFSRVTRTPLSAGVIPALVVAAAGAGQS